MAPFGKLYAYTGNPRTVGLLAIAKENGLDVELVETKPSEGVSDDYKKINKLGRIPTFVGTDGYILSEVMAIAVYLTSQNEKTSLLGKTKQDYASILRWISFCNTEVLTSMGKWFRPLIGMDPYNKKNVEDGQKATYAALKVLDDHLLINTYLVGERLTLADIMCASLVSRGFEIVLDKEYRKENVNVSRWYETIANQAMYKAIVPEVKLAEVGMKNAPPAKPKEEKAAPAAKKEKPKAQAVDEDDEPKPEAKPKHPLEALGRPTFAIDDWKRQFKNEETREVALPWFWQNVNFEEYSLWAMDFKYNDELTMTFMSNNQVGGLFTRLEGSRKYIMGCASVYGVTNDSVIKGAFLVRGQDATPAFEVAPDAESYSFTKLDPKKTEDREYVDSMFAWDKPIIVEGKEYQWADGKIFV